jgi:hypothetical protein
MILLTLILVFLIFASFLELVYSELNAKIIVLLLIGVLLIFVASLRFGDRDYTSYVEIYEDVNPFFSSLQQKAIHGEPGFILLNRLCKTIGVGYIGMFFIMALSSVSLSLNFFRKNTSLFLIAVLIYFCHVFMLRDMLQIRSGLAASISLYSFTFIKQRKLLKFLSVIILASMFHIGVAIIILVYLIYPIFIVENKRIIVLIIIGFIFGSILSASLLEFFFTNILYIPGVSLYVGDSENFKSLGLLNPVLLKSAVLVCLMIYYKQVIGEKVWLFEPLLISLAFSVFWLATFNQFAIFGARLATYLSNAEHILIPALFNTKINKIFLWFIIVCYCIFMFVSKFETFKDLSYYFL